MPSYTACLLCNAASDICASSYQPSLPIIPSYILNNNKRGCRKSWRWEHTACISRAGLAACDGRKNRETTQRLPVAAGDRLPLCNLPSLQATVTYLPAEGGGGGVVKCKSNIDSGSGTFCVEEEA